MIDNPRNGDAGAFVVAINMVLDRAIQEDRRGDINALRDASAHDVITTVRVRRDQSAARLSYLDGLRGFAALYVVLFHTLLVSAAPLHLTPGLRHFVSFGGTGVFLFFVLSGFSLSMTMPRHVATGRPLFSYTFSRFFRIAPLFYLIAAICLIRAGRHGESISPAAVLGCLTFLFNLFPGQEGFVPAAWTIGVEMLFYAFFPLIYPSRFRSQAALFAGSGVVFALMNVWLPRDYTYWSIVGWLPLFLVGMWAFAAMQIAERTVIRKRATGLALSLAGIIILVICALPEDSSHLIMTRIPIAFGYALVIIGLGLLKETTSLPKFFNFFGKISYSTYLVHALIIMRIDGMMVQHTATLPPDAALFVRAAIVLSLVTPLAWLLTRFVERPFEQLGRSVVRHIARPFDRLAHV